MRHLASLVIAGLGLALVACGPGINHGSGVDGGPNSSCSGNDTRCVGNEYQTCQNGQFVGQTDCPSACSAALGGCVQCDPAAGNTCNGNSVATCNADGTYGSSVMDCGSAQMCQNGSCSSACTADGVDLIYVVDEAHDMLSFDPRKLPDANAAFHVIGVPQCSPGPVLASWQAQSGETTANPFSMAVDRNATAWVLYTSGEIFKVSTADGSCVGNTGYTVQQNGMDLFGMGFVTDQSGGDTEKLYLGGGDVTATPGGKVAVVDPASPTSASVIGNLPNDGELSPELTGTGDAEFFGFFPGVSTAFVQQLDKTNGSATGPKWNISGGLGATVRAWAFAQWGGYFYIFVTTDDGLGNLNSTVRRINRQTMQYETVLQNLPYVIVGAGVSTCAPVVIGAPPANDAPGAAAQAAPAALQP